MLVNEDLKWVNVEVQYQHGDFNGSKKFGQDGGRPAAISALEALSFLSVLLATEGLGHDVQTCVRQAVLDGEKLRSQGMTLR